MTIQDSMTNFSLHPTKILLEEAENNLFKALQIYQILELRIPERTFMTHMCKRIRVSADHYRIWVNDKDKK